MPALAIAPVAVSYTHLGDEALVLDGVGQLHLAGGDDVVAIACIDEGGVDLRDGHGLAIVGGVLMGCEQHIGCEELLVHDEALSAEVGPVKRELDELGAAGLLGGEGGGAGNQLLGQSVLYHDGLTGLRIDQGSLELVLGAGNEVLVGHLVDDGYLGSGHQLVAVGLVGRGGMDVEEVHGLEMCIRDRPRAWGTM